MRWLLGFAVALCLVFSLDERLPENHLYAQGSNGIAVDNGFKISQVATDKIASNIFCMAVDPDGRVFVSGSGGAG